MKLCGETDKTLLYQLQKCNCSSHNTFLIVELEEGCQIKLTTSIVEMIEIKQDLLSIFFCNFDQGKERTFQKRRGKLTENYTRIGSSLKCPTMNYEATLIT